MSNNYPAYLPPGRITGRPIVGGPGAEIPGYASQAVGSPTIPGSSTQQPTERVRVVDIIRVVFENWLPFTASIFSGRYIPPRKPTYAWESPFGFTGEQNQRWGDFPSSIRPFPQPPLYGAVSGFMPMQDQYSLDWAYGKTPSGPGVATPIPLAWQISYPTLQKVTG